MRQTPKKLRERATRAALRLGNMVRRVVLSSSQGGAWGLQGYAIPDLRGGGSVATEGADDEPTELFGGIGIYARPADGDDAEAIVLQVGGEADHPVIAATRNEKARQRYVEEFGEPPKGSIAIFNSAGNARVLITADGDVQITPASSGKLYISRGGLTERVVLKSDFDGHTHLPGTYGAPSGGGPVTGVSGGAAAATGSSSVEVE